MTKHLPRLIGTVIGLAVVVATNQETAVLPVAVDVMFHVAGAVKLSELAVAALLRRKPVEAATPR